MLPPNNFAYGALLPEVSAQKKESTQYREEDTKSMFTLPPPTFAYGAILPETNNEQFNSKLTS